jgi:arylsulfatase A-like enzyme
MTVYETLAHVPLIIKTPSDGPAGKRIALVQNLDIVPTILDYVGIEGEKFGFQGKSLRPVIEKDETIHAYSYCAQYNWRSVTDGRFKLIISVRTGAIALYDLQADPKEKEDLIDIEVETARELLRVLKEWISEEEAGLTQKQRIRLSEEAVERLRALGYFK